MTTVLLAIHTAATLAMVGLIWFVQVVHYPLFAKVGTDRFPAYEAAHQRRTALVVGPPMIAELGTAALLAVAPPEGVPRIVPIAGLLLVLAIWVITAAVQVPLHGRLARGFDAAAHRALVWGNWPRTLLWTARGGLALWMLVLDVKS